MGGSGIRIGSEGSDGDMGDLSAFMPDPQVADRQMALLHATHGRFVPTGPEGAPEDINAFSQPPSQAVTPPLPQMPKAQTPVVKGDARAAVSRGPKTQLALHFAKAMGYAVPGTPDSPDELAFAKAAHQALLKMTKGMTVARFLASHQSPKTRDAFGKYLDAELRKGAAPVVKDPPNTAGDKLAVNTGGLK